MASEYGDDEVADGLLRLAAQLQTFAASLLGLELDYVIPDIQGLTGWVAGARSTSRQPVILHFRGPWNGEDATAIPAGSPTIPPPDHGAPVSLERYLDEIPAELLTDSTPSGAPSRSPPYLRTVCTASRPDSHLLTSKPDHPNLAVLLNVISDSGALLSGGLLVPAASGITLRTTAVSAAAMSSPPVPLPAPEPPPAPSGLPEPLPPGVATVGASWHPGCSLAECLRSPTAAASCGLDASGPGDQHLRFLLLQLVAAVCHLHAHGHTLGGGISPVTILLQPGGWLQLLPPLLDQPQPLLQPAMPLPRLPTCLRDLPPTLPALTRAWQHHALSTLDYLMLINIMAGRRLGDRTFHPFVPWVTDFTVPPRAMLTGSSSGGAGGSNSGSSSRGGSGGGGTGGRGGWHDLTQSRYRQAKGDLQLDVTFESSDVPHHIPQEPLSELSFCIYMARMTPRAVLQRAVRSHFEPREYPPSVEAMLARTPDECLPQLYTDPGIFRSIHPELPDLQLPEWASSPQEFIRWHRALLESDHVSRHLHHWLDLFFGYKLLGSAAVTAKNVYLTTQPQPRAVATAAAPGGGGAWSATADGPGATAQLYAPMGMHPPLFLSPHPPRLTSSRPTAAEVAGRGSHRLLGQHPHGAQAQDTQQNGSWLTPSGSMAGGAGNHGAGGGGGSSRVGLAACSDGGPAAVLAQLDSLELLGAVASRDGGLIMHEDYFPLSQALPPSRLEHPPRAQFPVTVSAASVDGGAGVAWSLRKQQNVQQQQRLRLQLHGEDEGLYPQAETVSSGAAGGVLALSADATARSITGRGRSPHTAEELPVTTARGALQRGQFSSEGWRASTGRKMPPVHDGTSSRWGGDGFAAARRGQALGQGRANDRCGFSDVVSEEEWLEPAARDSGMGPQQPAGKILGQRWTVEGSLELRRQDCWAIGKVVVQLYLGRCCYGPHDDAGYWLHLSNRLPAAAGTFVRLCFDPQVTSERLLSNPFFSPALHAAHELLRTSLYDSVPDAAGAAANLPLPTAPPVLLLPPQQPLPCQMGALAAAAADGRFDEVSEQRTALELCLPHIMHVLWQAADACGALIDGGSNSDNSSGSSNFNTVVTSVAEVPGVAPPTLQPMASDATGSAALATQVSGNVHDILLALLRLLPPDRVAANFLPYVCACLSCFVEQPQDAVSSLSRRRRLALPHRLLSATLQTQLLAASDLDLYVQYVLPLLLAALLCSEETVAIAADSTTAGVAAVAPSSGGDGSVGGVARALAVATVSDAAAAAVVALVARLPLPLVLERIVGPLLSYLTVGTSVPRLLVKVCAEMGGQLTARHVAPALLQLAVVSASPPPMPSSAGGAGRGAGRGRAQQGGRAVQQRDSLAHPSSSSSSPPPTEPWLQHQIYTALSVLTAIMDLLPREFLPRVFLHGLPPLALIGLSPHGSPATSPSQQPADAAAASWTPPPPAAFNPLTPIISEGLPPLLNCLLEPLAFRLAPGSLTMLAGLTLRAFVRLARPENMAWVVLPHLMPLLSNASPRLRAAYRANGTSRRTSDVTPSHDQGPPAAAQFGNSTGAIAATAVAAGGHGSVGRGRGPSAGPDAGRLLQRSRSSPSGEALPGGFGAGSPGQGPRTAGATANVAAAADAGDDEDGYWELVHCVYGYLVESSGLLTVRNLLPGWQAVEAGLTARLGWSPAAAGLWGICTPELQVKQEIASKQQRVAALQVAHLFIKEVGWSAPTTLAAPRSSPKDMPYSSSCGSGQGASISVAGAAGGGSGGTAATGVGHYSSSGGAGTAATAGAGGGGSEGFVWPQMLAIGSPTVVEGLAVGGAIGMASGGGGSGITLGLQTSLGGALASITMNGSRRTSGGRSGGGAAASSGRPETLSNRSNATAAAAASSGSLCTDAPEAKRGTELATAAPGGACGGGLGRDAEGRGRAREHSQQQGSASVAAPPPPAGTLPTVTSDSAAAAALARRRSDRVFSPEVDGIPGPEPDVNVAAVVASTIASDAGSSKQEHGTPHPAARLPAAELLARPSRASVFLDRGTAVVAAGTVSGAAPNDELVPAPATAAATAAAPEVRGKASTIQLVPDDDARTGARSVSVHPALLVARSDPLPGMPPAASGPTTKPPLSSNQSAELGGNSQTELATPVAAGVADGAVSQPLPPPSPFPTTAALGVMSTQQLPLSSQQPPVMASTLPARLQNAMALPPTSGSQSASQRAGGAPVVTPLLIPPPVLSDGQLPDTGSHRWSWLPPVGLTSVVHTAAGYGGSSVGRASRAWMLAAAAAPPPAGDVWSLQAAVVHSWPAHRDRIRAVAVHPGECAVLTAGRGMVGGREGPVVRVWSLSDCQARVQYGGHRAAVHSLLLFRAARAGGAVVASLDAAGQLHVWAYDNGQQLACFAPVNVSGGIATGGGGAGGGASGAGGAGVAAAAIDPSLDSVELSLSSAWSELIDREGGERCGVRAEDASAAVGPDSERSSVALRSGAAPGGASPLRSGHYTSSQPSEPRGWQSLGGLKTGRQLSAATASPGPSPTGSSGGTGSIRALATGMVAQLGAAPAAVAAAAAAPVVAAAAVAAGQPGQGTLRFGFTAMCSAPEEHQMLYVGTADARVCAIDLGRGSVVADWLASAAVRHDADDAVTTMCVPGGGVDASPGFGWSAQPSSWLCPEVVAAGSRGGRVVLLDRRCGTAAAAFRAHGGEVTSMASSGNYNLISAGGDRQLRFWDLRRCTSSSASCTASSPGASGGAGGATAACYAGAVGMGYDSRTGPWEGWQGPRGGSNGAGREPCCDILDAMSPVAVGAAVHRGEGLYGLGVGVRAGVLDVTLPLQALGSASTGPAMAQQQQQYQQYQQQPVGVGVAAPALLRSCLVPREGVQGLRVLRDCVLMTSGSSIGVMALPREGVAPPAASGSSGAASGASGPSFERLRNGRGGRESAAVTGLAVLPCCRLLVVAGDDGAVRICR